MKKMVYSLLNLKGPKALIAWYFLIQICFLIISFLTLGVLGIFGMVLLRVFKEYAGVLFIGYIFSGFLFASIVNVIVLSFLCKKKSTFNFLVVPISILTTTILYLLIGTWFCSIMARHNDVSGFFSRLLINTIIPNFGLIPEYAEHFSSLIFIIGYLGTCLLLFFSARKAFKILPPSRGSAGTVLISAIEKLTA